MGLQGAGLGLLAGGLAGGAIGMDVGLRSKKPSNWARDALYGALITGAGGAVGGHFLQNAIDTAFSIPRINAEVRRVNAEVQQAKERARTIVDLAHGVEEEAKNAKKWVVQNLHGVSTNDRAMPAHTGEVLDMVQGRSGVWNTKEASAVRITAFYDELCKIAQDMTEAAELPQPPLAVQDQFPHGLEGRLRRSPAPRVKCRKTEGPRAYAPRL